MLRDLRHAARLLISNKGWTIVVVLSLALGIGANTAIFTAVNGLLLRTIPVDRPETLVRFRAIGDNELGTDFSEYARIEPAGGLRTATTFPYPTYLAFRAANRTLVDLFACAPQFQMSAVVDGQAEVVSGFIASGNYFQVLGIQAEAGRTLTPDDDRPGAPPVAVISHGYFIRRFGGDRKAIGSVLRIASVPMTIVGVAPPAFTGVQQPLGEAPDVTFPLALDPQLAGAADPGRTEADYARPRLERTTTFWLQIMGRLKPGVTPEQVQGNLAGMFDQVLRDSWAGYLGSLPPGERSAARNQNRTKAAELRVQPGAHGTYDVSPDTYRAITLLGIVVALVLLIVCANVANLLLSRAISRQREMSVRLSLGATRARLIRQLLTESVLLAAVGAAAGLLVAIWGRRLLPDNLAPTAPIDWRILGFVAALTVASGVLFGIAPALRSSHLNVNEALKEGGRAISGGRSGLAKTLVVAQVAISLVLLVGAGLFLRTVRNLRDVDVGFKSGNLLLVPINPALNRYDQPRILNLYGSMLEELSRVPGVRTATASQPALLSGGVNTTRIYIQGRARPDDRNGISRVVVAENFFEAMGIPLLAGRAFGASDGQTAPKVAVLNETAVRRYFDGKSPIGQRFGYSFETSGEMEIVGVVGDAKYNSLRDAAPATMYVPYRQPRLASMTFELRTASDPAAATSAVRDAMRRIDPNVPILKVTTQSEQIEARFAQEKVFAQACTLFGGLAVLVASIGLFGLMSYNVARRTNEIGIRMALGADRGTVVGMVMREAMRLIAGGLAIGLATVLGAGRFVASLLFDLAPADPWTLAGAAALLIALAAAAGYLPARTASKVDPMVALRTE